MNPARYLYGDGARYPVVSSLKEHLATQDRGAKTGAASGPPAARSEPFSDRVSSEFKCLRTAT
ncbi:MAG: hypothetical protein JWO80_5896 [Bryobacterales bacterium]|nr:hypothetical protein [Bryobacterales bacterium]